MQSGFFERLRSVVEQPAEKTSKAEIAEIVAAALGNFRHAETGQSLDQRL
jgi:hypothetical protein